ncbi:hypothetical protein [Streptomyces sp. KMM 9044]|uniref:hypothetical protein n=1 Tax=Streptomyces sp. KMM 9044 TaxID=2744474 RepID=UPI0021510F4E|nr:hypothetical protein [Streptomyces sp. KMM 9044]WAX80738.1 hypothetical protein HUV60_026790 [Streptomyces sp. KMM 9044]
MEEEVADLQALWKAKRVKTGTYVTALHDLNARKNELLVDKADHAVPAGTRSITEELPANGWENLPTERQRIVVRKVLRAALIRPAESREGRFDPARVEPVFHTV